jgi:hypothetical protein
MIDIEVTTLNCEHNITLSYSLIEVDQDSIADCEVWISMTFKF